MRIFLAEPHDDFRRVLSELLRRTGHQVESTADLLGLDERLRVSSPDALVIAIELVASQNGLLANAEPD